MALLKKQIIFYSSHIEPTIQTWATYFLIDYDYLHSGKYFYKAPYLIFTYMYVYAYIFIYTILHNTDTMTTVTKKHT